MAFDWLEALELEYDINNLELFPFTKRTTIFVDYLADLLKKEQFSFLSAEDVQKMNFYLDAARRYANRKLTDADLEQQRIDCWLAYDKSIGHSKALYRIIVTLLYSEYERLHNPSRQFTDFELFFELLSDFGEEYPQNFFEHIHRNI